MSTREPRPSPESSALISAYGLRKSYGRTEALRGASLELREGEILAVAGASGSGKSTLLHCLSGIVRPDEGVVTYGGEQLGLLPEGRLRRAASQRLRGGVPVRAAHPRAHRARQRGDAAAARRYASRSGAAAGGEWLERFGVRGQAEVRPGEMSGGQSQRVALARALVTGPRVVFADEPTGALDTLAGEQVMTALVHTARESATAVLLITHDAQVAAYADREVVMSDGVLRSGSDDVVGQEAARREG